MFQLKTWLKNAVINGVRSGEFSPDYAAILVVEQVDKGRFSAADAEEIYRAVTPEGEASP